MNNIFSLSYATILWYFKFSPLDAKINFIKIDITWLLMHSIISLSYATTLWYFNALFGLSKNREEWKLSGIKSGKNEIKMKIFSFDMFG